MSAIACVIVPGRGFILGFNELTVYFLSTLDGPLEVHIALSLKRKGSRPKKTEIGQVESVIAKVWFGFISSKIESVVTG